MSKHTKLYITRQGRKIPYRIVRRTRSKTYENEYLYFLYRGAYQLGNWFYPAVVSGPYTEEYLRVNFQIV